MFQDINAIPLMSIEIRGIAVGQGVRLMSAWFITIIGSAGSGASSMA
jgi:hypothetical protein